jgi:hypothetical protein
LLHNSTQAGTLANKVAEVLFNPDFFPATSASTALQKPARRRFTPARGFESAGLRQAVAENRLASENLY